MDAIETRTVPEGMPKNEKFCGDQGKMIGGGEGLLLRYPSRTLSDGWVLLRDQLDMLEFSGTVLVQVQYRYGAVR